MPTRIPSTLEGILICNMWRALSYWRELSESRLHLRLDSSLWNKLCRWILCILKKPRTNQEEQSSPCRWLKERRYVFQYFIRIRKQKQYEAPVVSIHRFIGNCFVLSSLRSKLLHYHMLIMCTTILVSLSVWEPSQCNGKNEYKDSSFLWEKLGCRTSMIPDMVLERLQPTLDKAI